MSVTQTRAIKLVLEAFTHSDLAALYTPDMEVQVEAAQDNGSVIEGEHAIGDRTVSWRGYTDGESTWKSFRIPYNAATNPNYNEKPMTWALEEHALGIGLTGWDWHAKVSKWVGFDFDAMIGHSQLHNKRLTDAELLEIERVVCEVPWVTVRRSTSGKGLHLYVMLNDVATDTHTEHAALARAVLGMLAVQTGYPLHTAVDACGHVLWVWHRKMQNNPDGLKLVKQGHRLIDIPINWREHVAVVSGQRKRTIPDWVKEENRQGLEKLLEELSGQHQKIRLDEGHLRLMAWIKDNEESCYSSCWNVDHHMFQTHTETLAAAHKALGLRGPFATITTGSSRQNCFAYPLKNGAWAVRRYSTGVHEADTWTQDGVGWTRCFYNRDPDLRSAAVANGGIEDKDGSFQFPGIEPAVNTMGMLGTVVTIPTKFWQRSSKLSMLKDGRVHFEFTREMNDSAKDLEGWLDKKGFWRRIFSIRREPDDGAATTVNCDGDIRHLVVAGEDSGWAIKTDDWQIEPLTHVKIHLAGLGLKTAEMNEALSACISNPWKIVNRPFEPEYPGEREWNRDAVAFKWPPAPESDNLSFPTWMKVLNHCGSGLDTAVRADDWCKKNGVMSGSTYLLYWIANLFQRPYEPLPYLFFYGPQGSGKSIFFESIQAILTSGVVNAGIALTNSSSFNGELRHAILGYIEEMNLAATPAIYNKLKELVTAKFIMLHPKGKDPVPIPNTLHWVQCGNDLRYVPAFPNDTRIVVIKVDTLHAGDEIPKTELLRLIERESPDFIRYCLDLELPTVQSRLALPVIETFDKREVQRSNMSMPEAFIHEMCKVSVGNMVLYADFWEAFQNWLEPKEKLMWTQQRMGKMLPMEHAKGKFKKNNSMYVINLSLDQTAPRNFGPRLVIDDGMIVQDTP